MRAQDRQIIGCEKVVTRRPKAKRRAAFFAFFVPITTRPGAALWAAVTGQPHSKRNIILPELRFPPPIFSSRPIQYSGPLIGLIIFFLFLFPFLARLLSPFGFGWRVAGL